MDKSDLSRTGRYLARVETHLQALSHDTARRDFLLCEIGKWEERYTRFITTEGESHRCSDDPAQATAFDFVETLAALDVIGARYAERKPA